MKKSLITFQNISDGKLKSQFSWPNAYIMQHGGGRGLLSAKKKMGTYFMEGPFLTVAGGTPRVAEGTRRAARRGSVVVPRDDSGRSNRSSEELSCAEGAFLNSGWQRENVNTSVSVIPAGLNQVKRNGICIYNGNSEQGCLSLVVYSQFGW